MYKIHPALLITTRELREQARDWRVIVPMLTLGAVFPFVLTFIARQLLGYIQDQGANISMDRVVPFLLLMVGFFPITIALTIAFESFAGEKERGSLEALLHTPLSDAELYFGKLLAAVVPALLASFLGIVVYLFGLARNQIAFPGAELLIHIAVLTTVQAVVMISAAVVVSTQTTSVRAANLMAAAIILPFGVLIQVESLVIVWGDLAVLPWMTLGLLALAVLLTRVGLVHFRREEMLNREIDRLDLGGAWRIFVDRLRGSARNPWEWYLCTVSQAIRSLALPLLLTLIALLFGGWLGVNEVGELPPLIPLTGGEVVTQRLAQTFSGWPLFSISPVIAVWWQNVRVILISFALGLVSFGVLGMLPTVFSVGVTGYLMGAMQQLGIPVWVYLVGFILPHGMVELAAAALGAAGILRMGAALATPTPGKSLGEVWLTAFADWTKVMLGVVTPLLFVAAAIEVWVTPRLALWMVSEYNIFTLP